MLDVYSDHLGSVWDCMGLWFYVMMMIWHFLSYFNFFDIDLILNWYWIDYVKLIPCFFHVDSKIFQVQDMYKIRSRYVQDMFKGVNFLDKIWTRVSIWCQFFGPGYQFFMTRSGQGYKKMLYMIRSCRGNIEATWGNMRQLDLPPITRSLSKFCPNFAQNLCKPLS